MQKHPLVDPQKITWEKHVFLVAITALLVLLGFGNTSSASIAIHGNREKS